MLKFPEGIAGGSGSESSDGSMLESMQSFAVLPQSRVPSIGNMGLYFRYPEISLFTTLY